MLIHVYNHVYIMKASEPQADAQSVREKGIELLACLPGIDCLLEHMQGDIDALAAAIDACVSAGGKAAVYWPAGADDSAMIVVINYLVRCAGMTFPNAFVLVADRFLLVQFTSPLLPQIANGYSKVLERRFFFDMLSQVSYTPNLIIPNLYVGSLGTLGNQDRVRGLGIQAVLRLDHLDGRSPLQWADDFVLKDMPIPDGKPLPAETLHQGVDFIQAQRSNGKSVLVHCVGGVSRSVTFVLAYLISVMSMSLPDAYARVVFYRAVARPHGELFMSLVQHYGLPYDPDAAYQEHFPEQLLEEAYPTTK